MSQYTRMINLMARETPANFRAMLKEAKAEIVAHLNAATDEEDNPNLAPDSQEALESTQAEGAQFRDALVTWKALSKEERVLVEVLLEKSGWPDPEEDLHYDLDALLQCEST